MDRIALLRQAGELLYGPEWHRAFARGLGPLHPGGARDTADDRMVRRWMAGHREVPAWVFMATARLLDAERESMETSLTVARALAGNLKAVADTAAGDTSPP